MKTIQLLLLISLCVIIAYMLLKYKKDTDMSPDEFYQGKTSKEIADEKEAMRTSEEIRVDMENEPKRLEYIEQQQKNLSVY